MKLASKNYLMFLPEPRVMAARETMKTDDFTGIVYMNYSFMTTQV